MPSLISRSLHWIVGKAAGQMDVSYSPNRLETAKSSVQKVIIDVFDQNPISSLGVDLSGEDLVDDGLHERVRLVRADGAHGTRDHR